MRPKWLHQLLFKKTRNLVRTYGFHAFILPHFCYVSTRQSNAKHQGEVVAKQLGFLHLLSRAWLSSCPATFGKNWLQSTGVPATVRSALGGTPHSDRQVDLVIFRSPMLHVLSVPQNLQAETKVQRRFFSHHCSGAYFVYLIFGKPIKNQQSPPLYVAFFRSQFMECKYDYWGGMTAAGTAFPTLPG